MIFLFEHKNKTSQKKHTPKHKLRFDLNQQGFEKKTPLCFVFLQKEKLLL